MTVFTDTRLTLAEKEAIIANQIEAALPVRYRLPSEADQKLFAALFAQFSEWCVEEGLRDLPASGFVVAAYLLDLHFAGAGEQAIGDAIAAIRHAHECAQRWVDWAPINAALDFISDQTKEDVY
jgi:hypothetical protein